MMKQKGFGKRREEKVNNILEMYLKDLLNMKNSSEVTCESEPNKE